MEKLIDNKSTIFSQLINSPSYSQFKLYPQMPNNQIKHYLKIASRKQNQITIQLKPSDYTTHFTEITGRVKLSPKTSQIILTPNQDHTIHLVQPNTIRHLRLA